MQDHDAIALYANKIKMLFCMKLQANTERWAAAFLKRVLYSQFKSSKHSRVFNTLDKENKIRNKNKCALNVVKMGSTCIICKKHGW